jgi:hypothetical protein
VIADGQEPANSHAPTWRARLSARAMPSEVLFFLGLSAIVGLLAALPVFPSGDGPVHIYLSHILGLLALRPASPAAAPYVAVYAVRHLVQPYALHYFWLIAAEHFVTVAVAEKSFVLANVLVNALGFRLLARQLSGRVGASSPVSLWILPLLLSWALASGFLNFCFAQGILFAAYALYLRIAAARLTRARIAIPVAFYITVLALLILSHPVPLLMLLGLQCGDAILLLLRKQKGYWPAGLLLTAVAFIFPMLIADKAQVADSLLRDLRPHMAQLLAIVSGDRLSMFVSGSFVGITFTAMLVALVPTALVLMVRGGWTKRLFSSQATQADRLCLTATVLLLCTLTFPESMNGSALFADRMVPLLWPLVFICVASVTVSEQVTRWCTALAMLATMASLTLALVYLLPAARSQEALTRAPLPRAARGLFFTAPGQRHPFRKHFDQALLGWGGARAFAASDDVLVNTPWMQLTIVPIRERGKAGLLRDELAGSYSESPDALGKLLQGQSPQRALALQAVDFLLYSDAGATTEAVRASLPTYLQSDAPRWSCMVRDFYAVCTRRGTVSSEAAQRGSR